METKKNPTLDSWESFTSGSFLKTGNVDSDKEAFVCINIELIKDARSGQEVMKPRLTLEHNGIEYLFDLNMTNSNFLKMNGMSTPKAVIGSVLYFKKALVRDPKKGIEVESLRISRVEKK